MVNDVSLAVESLKRFIEHHPEHQLAWVANDGREAVHMAAADRPDLILMDLVMPKMDGVEATRQIMAHSPTAILIVTASVDRLTSKVFEALAAGALDAVNTPVLGGPTGGPPSRGAAGGESDDHGSALASKVKTIARLVGHRHNGPAVARTQAAVGSRPPLVVVGASSGGPGALALLLSSLTPTFPACVCIVQHIDSHFIRGLVDWLAAKSRLPVSIAEEGDLPRESTVFVAGTDRHLVLKRGSVLGYDENPKECIHRPSVDVFMHSIATHWTGRGAGVILTGMGSDGADGLLALRARGFLTIAQDEATSAIYGMPKIAAERGAAEMVLPLQAIAPALEDYVAKLHLPRRVS